LPTPGAITETETITDIGASVLPVDGSDPITETEVITP
jgi:hypothetical protein